MEPATSQLHIHQLPLSKVVLYSSGVGYVQHDGTVQRESHVDLRFTVDQINDMLKSLVVQDARRRNESYTTISSGWI
jgi:hypothetical protein